MSDNNENKDSDEGINDENDSDPGVANGRNQVSHTANRIP